MQKSKRNSCLLRKFYVRVKRTSHREHKYRNRFPSFSFDNKKYWLHKFNFFVHIKMYFKSSEVAIKKDRCLSEKKKEVL